MRTLSSTFRGYYDRFVGRLVAGAQRRTRPPTRWERLLRAGTPAAGFLTLVVLAIGASGWVLVAIWAVWGCLALASDRVTRREDRRHGQRLRRWGD
jgi:peptidoglycan/LPS O-acetylase OafA/YrhL